MNMQVNEQWRVHAEHFEKVVQNREESQAMQKIKENITDRLSQRCFWILTFLVDPWAL